MKGRALSILAVVIVTAGCAAPAAQESQLPSESAAATPSVPAFASGTPIPVVPTPTAPSDPTATATPATGVDLPEGMLPPNSRAIVVVDALQIRESIGLGAPVVATLAANTVVELDWTGPRVADGLDWYPVQFGDRAGYAAGGANGVRYIELAPPRCNETDPDLAALTSITDWEQLACYGDRSLTVVGTYGCPVCGSYLPGSYEPPWLAHPGLLSYLGSSPHHAVRPLVLHFAPGSGLESPPNASIIRVTGHFNDLAATTCTMTLGEENDPSSLPLDSVRAELYCRERFVVDAYEVIGTDPDFQYPPAP